MLLAAACGGVLEEESPSADDLLAQLEPPPCAEPVPPTGDGHHRAGDDCLSCHRQGGDATPYTFAGTLYADSGGTAAAPGVTLHLLNGDGALVTVITEGNGNFWSTEAIAMPAVAFVARCPEPEPMVTPLGERDLGCNRAGCHTSGFRIR
jgi:hypothetical protein